MFQSRRTLKVLIIGGSSFIAGAFACRYGGNYHTTLTYDSHPVADPKCRAVKINLRSEARLCELFAELRPDVVIHAAAMTDVAACEKDWERTYDLNVRATANILDLCHEIDARLIYLSSDMVFDGRQGNYEEQDPAYPLSRYGKSKLLAEELVCGSASSPHTVLRLAQVYGFGCTPHSRGFIGWLQESLAAGEAVKLFTDEYRSPVYLEDVIDLLDQAIPGNSPGVFNIAGPEKISRYDFGHRFAEALGYNPACITPVSLHSYTSGPPRPANLSMNISRMQRHFRILPAKIKTALRRMRQIQDHAISLEKPWDRKAIIEQPEGLAAQDMLG